MSEKVQLFDSSDSESDDKLGINQNYADRYQVWRQKEELQKLKALSQEISSESSLESEYEEPPVVDKDFLVTLSLLKGNDPRVNDKDYKFYQESSSREQPHKVKKEKPMYMKDYERTLVLERNGKFSSDEEEEECPRTSKRPAYPEEVEAVTKDFLSAAYKDEDDEEKDSDFGGLFKVKEKTKDENEQERAEHIKWLKGEEANVDEKTKKDLMHLRNFWTDPDLDDGEKFLRDYILNQEDILKDKDGNKGYDDVTVADLAELSEEEKVQAEQDIFEHKFNFRFEEPDQEFIKRYPRIIGDSLRREDNRRKAQREDYAERKRKEREQKREELKKLKAIKRKEIEDRFLKLKEASGKDELNLDESDMESDFNPDKHDMKMRELFDDEYYGVEEEDKPQFEFDEEIDEENWDKWNRTSTMKTDCQEQNDSSSDDESDNQESNAKISRKSQVEQDIIESTQRKKGRKKSLFAKVISKPKPLFDPDGKSFDEYLDEYYRLDYEDVIGDQPVRFKYRKVVPNDFGLSVEEILTANDKELNRWCSIKKTCQYRREEEEMYDVQAFKRKAEKITAKESILQSVYSPPDEEGKPSGTKKKKRKKKKTNILTADVKQEDCAEGGSTESIIEQQKKESNDSVETAFAGKAEAEQEDGDRTNCSVSKKKQKKRKSSLEAASLEQMSTKQDGDDAASKKKRKKNSSFEAASPEQISTKQERDNDANSTVSKKKKKKNNSFESVLPEAVKQDGAGVSGVASKKRKRKRKKKSSESTIASTVNLQDGEKDNSGKKKHKKWNTNKPVNTDKRLALSDDRLAAFGLNPKKFKNSIIYSKK